MPVCWGGAIQLSYEYYYKRGMILVNFIINPGQQKPVSDWLLPFFAGNEKIFIGNKKRIVTNLDRICNCNRKNHFIFHLKVTPRTYRNQ